MYLFLTPTQRWVELSGQHQAPSSLIQGNKDGACWVWGWVGPKGGLGC